MPIFWSYAAPFVMLLASNVFMTFAWYGHLKHRTIWLPLVILVSWLIALPEYALAVPANRWGAQVYSPAQLKVVQETISLLVFSVFSVAYLGVAFRWTTALGFLLVIGGAGLIFVQK